MAIFKGDPKKEVGLRSSSDDLRLDSVLDLVKAGGRQVLAYREALKTFSPSAIRDLKSASAKITEAAKELDMLVGALEYRMKNTT